MQPIDRSGTGLSPNNVSRPTGFTKIELVVTIAILGLLLALLGCIRWMVVFREMGLPCWEC